MSTKIDPPSPDGQFERDRVVLSTRPDEPCQMLRVGKKAAGAVLDGREWREMPASPEGFAGRGPALGAGA